MSDLDRRGFVGAAAGCLAAALLPGCASLPAARVPTPADGRIRLSLAEHPQLARPGGSLRVFVEGEARPLYVLTQADGSHAALSPVCTHRGCTVDIAGVDLVCPCHGSTYDRTGKVLRGPAERALTRFPAEVVGGDLTIRLDGGS